MNKKYYFLFLILGFTLNSIAGSEVAVFIQSTHPVKKVEKSFKEVFSSDKVTNYSKYRDFKKRIGKADVIIAPSAFKSKKYKKIRSLSVNGKNKTKYILLSTDKNWKKKKRNKGKVGITEIATRKQLKVYLKDVFGKKFKGVKTVSKVSDLFPLLVFGSVDFVAMPPHLYKELKSRFSTKVFKVGESESVGTTSVFIRNDVNESKVVKSLKRISKLKSIGFSGVK